MSQQPKPMTAESILLEAINEGWFLKSKEDYPNGFSYSDVKKIQDKAKSKLRRTIESVEIKAWSIEDGYVTAERHTKKILEALGLGKEDNE